MSTSAAIAAVTETIRALLETQVEQVATASVVAQPPTLAASDGLTNAVNVFLYQITLPGSWRNIEAYGGMLPGELSPPPLALELHYLLTAYAENDQLGQQLLGAAMTALHDRPVLDPAFIRASVADIPDAAGLDRQVDRVRVTPTPLGPDDMSRLWTMFATPYRLSVGYQACVVLIDSKRAARTAAPVLYQGRNGRGPTAVAGATLPVLEAVVPENHSPAVYPGKTVSLLGTGLAAALSMTWQHQRSSRPPVTIERTDADNPGLDWNAPEEASLPAGVYTVTVTVPMADGATTTNAVPVAVAPAIVSELPIEAGANSVTVTCTPAILLEQDVFLLVGDRPLPSGPRKSDTTQLTFDLTGVPNGTFPVRLRVDRVDSSLINYGKTPPEFDADRVVKVQR